MRPDSESLTNFRIPILDVRLSSVCECVYLYRVPRPCCVHTPPARLVYVKLLIEPPTLYAAHLRLTCTRLYYRSRSNVDIEYSMVQGPCRSHSTVPLDCWKRGSWSVILMRNAPQTRHTFGYLRCRFCNRSRLMYI